MSDAHLLDDLDLLVAGGLEDDVELVLLLFGLAASRRRRAGGAAAATATGAAAVTSKVSSNCFTNSQSSISVISLNASSSSSVLSFAMWRSSRSTGLRMLVVHSGWGREWSVRAGRTAARAGQAGSATRPVRRPAGVGRCPAAGAAVGPASAACSALRRRPAPRRGAPSPPDDRWSCSAAASRANCDSGAAMVATALDSDALHRPGELGKEHLARLQVGQLADLLGRHRLALDHAALDHQRGVGPGEVAQALGGLDRVARDEGDRGRAGEQRRRARPRPASAAAILVSVFFTTA